MPWPSSRSSRCSRPLRAAHLPLPPALPALPAWDTVHADDAVAKEGKFLLLFKRAANRVLLTRDGESNCLLLRT